MIHSVDLVNKIISIKKPKKLEFFYFQAGLMHMFKRYLYKGNFISLVYDEDKVVVKNRRDTHLVLYVIFIFAPSKFHNRYFYDKKILNDTLKDFLAGIDHHLFLDLEMTMPNFNEKGPFDSEIIQAGMVLCDKNLDVIEEKSIYIKPTIARTLNGRTKKFLKIEDDLFESRSVPYEHFYEYFKTVIDKYNPAIIVYGKNDILILDKSYKYNNVLSLKNNCRFINLNQIVRNFYNLRNDPGLFRLYQFYTKAEQIQVHNALDDSYITREVFNCFRNDVENDTHSNVELRNLID